MGKRLLAGAPRWTLVVLVGVFAVFVSACGSSDTSTTGGGGPTASETTASDAEGDWATSATGKEIAAEVKKLYAGDYVPPPTKGPKAEEGKNVWYISCGQEYEACASMSSAFEEAGKELGWTVTLQDSKASQETAGKLIKQALAANVDGIAISSTDCPNIKSALQEAKAENTPVVNFAGLDCDYEGFGGGEKLFTKTVNSRGPTFLDFGKEYAEARADVLINELQGEGELLSLEEQSQVAQQVFGKAFSERITEACPDCISVPVQFTFAEVPTEATQVWQAAIQSHPDADTLSNPIDALMGLGLKSTIASSGREIWIMGAEGAPPNLQLIEEGAQGAALDVSGYEWQIWGLADTLNRVFAGSEEFPDEGGGWILVDKEHNLPPAGEKLQPPVDYRAAFNAIWSGKS